ncbi:MAG: F0F1 ATP synthase subunit gamma [Rhodospirillales bacterium]|nr:F0F1 ATP synthase subunit gamma [Rhodospirillales bacterium]MSP80153.1 F0F1 ATP synthase subunit gamma [Rhodospirillales bacterium]
MPSLKSFKLRINSVKSTRKITSAMKMVAAAKLRRAQQSAEAARPYSERMRRMVSGLAAGQAGMPGAPKLLAGTGRDQVHLLIPCTADRGLCGALNSSIVRDTRRLAQELIAQGHTVKFLPVGRKGRDVLKRDFGSQIAGEFTGIGRKGVRYAEAAPVAEKIVELFAAGEFDVATLIFNRFKSAMTQVVTRQQVVPFPLPEAAETASGPRAVPIFEPDEGKILGELLPRNLAVQTFQALLESAASEQGARMTAMDSATRNAGDMIDRLTLKYNRTRQANITKELIEIISGAEAL